MSGRAPRIEGETDIHLSRYAEEIVRSGFPAIRPLPTRARRTQLDSYIARIVDRDFEEMGQSVRKPDTSRRWMAAYAAAASTTASLETIRDAAPGWELDTEVSSPPEVDAVLVIRAPDGSQGRILVEAKPRATAAAVAELRPRLASMPSARPSSATTRPPHERNPALVSSRRSAISASVIGEKAFDAPLTPPP